jgi:hypothetical protein
MAMRNFTFIAIAFISILLNGCEDATVGISFCSCRNSIDDVRALYGDPDEIEKYDSDNYHCHTYWYWCKGLSIVFIWGDGITGCCRKSTNTFEPACAG